MNTSKLEVAVKAYHQKSFNDWLKISLISGAIIISIVTLIHIYQAISYFRALLHNQTVTTQILELTKALENADSQTKKHELTKKQYCIVCQHKNPADYLNTISQSIPDHTLLTQFLMTPESLSFSGFTLNEEQLAQFMATLSTTPLSNVELVSSTNEAAGLKFTIKYKMNRIFLKSILCP